ncbi:suppressor protein SRP40-like [Heracleum sosnowskyi]|uniref:Suppressor protein SRP40-like n=1 Tax=Heracleum sosnowskyi TaxID=360622 RepID=A0AAD8HF33_9APIA|nr:suppressor protein SRP40-like [Heracleum sosnowskyi]
MESTKKVTSGSSSSFVDLFGPKDSSMHSSSSTGLFSSVFGPSSTGLGRDFSRSGLSRTPRHQNSAHATEYGSAKHETQDYRTPKGSGQIGSVQSKDWSTIYQNETVEPCYFNSSIYYGGQEIYSTNLQSKNTYNTFKKEGGDDDSNGSNLNSASRGNWWQGSLYY